MGEVELLNKELLKQIKREKGKRRKGGEEEKYII